MASSSQGVTVEIPGHTNAPAEGPKPSARAANPEDRYAPGAAAAETGSKSWLQSNLYLILFCVGWLCFPCWWAGALLGLKAGRTGRSRFSRQERTAWQACIALSIIGIALFLLFIIWYGADPQGAKATLIRYTGIGGPSNLQGASPSPSVSPSPSPVSVPSTVAALTPAQIAASEAAHSSAHLASTVLVDDQCGIAGCRPMQGSNIPCTRNLRDLLLAVTASVRRHIKENHLLANCMSDDVLCPITTVLQGRGKAHPPVGCWHHALLTA
jgi:hypothetical protein